MAVVNSIAYTGGRRAADVPIEKLGEALCERTASCGSGCTSRPRSCCARCRRSFGLHDLAVEDAHAAHQRPKLEEYGDALFIVLRTARRVPEATTSRSARPTSSSAAGYVVSVRHGASVPTSTSVTGARARRSSSTGPGFVLYALMDFVVDNYFPIVDGWKRSSSKLEEEIFAATIDREPPMSIYDLKRDLLGLKRAVSPLMDISRPPAATRCPIVTPRAGRSSATSTTT